MVKDKFGDCSLCGKKAEEDCQMPQVEG